MADLQPTVVLLVDDEAILRMIAGQGLQDAGFEVIEADCAESALEILKARSDIAVLFTDVNMPGPLDGLDLAERVHSQWPTIHLVITSGRGLPDPLAGDDRFVAKPYSIAELIKAVDEAAKQAR